MQMTAIEPIRNAKEKRRIKAPVIISFLEEFLIMSFIISIMSFIVSFVGR